MHIQIRSDGLHRITGTKPFAKFCVRTEQCRIIHTQFSGQCLVLFFGITQIICRHKRFMVTQQKRDMTTCIRRLLLQFIEQPKYLRHIFATVKYITDNHQMVGSKTPMVVFINDIVASQQAHHAIQLAMGVRHHKHFIRLSVLPFRTFDRMQLHIKRITPFVVRDMKGEILRKYCISRIFYLPLGCNAYDAHLSVRFINHIRSVCRQFLLLLLILLLTV